MASKCASKTLFVGNLHASLEETDLLEIFKSFGRIVECCKRWCHYGFIQFATEDEARLAFNNLNGSRVRGRPMRIEFQRKKIRNLAALLEAEAQAKVNQNVHFTLNDDDSTSPFLQHLSQQNEFNNDENAENISPRSLNSMGESNFNFFLATPSQQQFTESTTSTKFNFTSNDNNVSGTNFMQKNDMQLVSQFAFMDDKTAMQPLGTRNLNIQQQQNGSAQTLTVKVSSNSAFEDFNENSIAKEIANSVLLSSSAKKPSSTTNQLKSTNKFELDNKSTAWFNYLLDKAAQCPTVRSTTTLKSNAIGTNDLSSSHSISTSSSPRSPFHNYHYQVSPNLKNSSSNADNTSIMIYRSLNTSNTIFVQPTDILEPLEIGDFNEYKLFPQSNSKEEFYTLMSSPNVKLYNDMDAKTSADLDLLVELTPPSSVSISSTSSSRSTSTSSSNTSPVTRALSRRRLQTQKLF